jgi:hypothetical protein
MKRLALVAVLGTVALAGGCVVYPTPYGPDVALGVPVAPAYGPYYSPYYYGGYYGVYPGYYGGWYYGGRHYGGRHYGRHHHRGR